MSRCARSSFSLLALTYFPLLSISALFSPTPSPSILPLSKYPSVSFLCFTWHFIFFSLLTLYSLNVSLSCLSLSDAQHMAVLFFPLICLCLSAPSVLLSPLSCIWLLVSSFIKCSMCVSIVADALTLQLCLVLRMLLTFGGQRTFEC